MKKYSFKPRMVELPLGRPRFGKDDLRSRIINKVEHVCTQEAHLAANEGGSAHDIAHRLHSNLPDALKQGVEQTVRSWRQEHDETLYDYYIDPNAVSLVTDFDPQCFVQISNMLEEGLQSLMDFSAALSRFARNLPPLQPNKNTGAASAGVSSDLMSLAKSPANVIDSEKLPTSNNDTPTLLAQADDIGTATDAYGLGIGASSNSLTGTLAPYSVEGESEESDANAKLAHRLVGSLDPPLFSTGGEVLANGISSLTKEKRIQLEEEWPGPPEDVKGKEKELLAWIYKQYSALAQQVERETGIDAALLLGVVRKESGGDPRAKAKTTTALGLMQLVDGAAKDVAQRRGYTSDEIENFLAHRVDPVQALYMGAEYLQICKEVVMIDDERLVLLGYYQGAYGIAFKIGEHLYDLLTKQPGFKEQMGLHTMSEKDLEEYLAGLKPNESRSKNFKSGNCKKLFPKMTDEQIANMIDSVIKQYMGEPVPEAERKKIEAERRNHYKKIKQKPTEKSLQNEIDNIVMQREQKHMYYVNDAQKNKHTFRKMMNE